MNGNIKDMGRGKQQAPGGLIAVCLVAVGAFFLGRATDKELAADDVTRSAMADAAANAAAEYDGSVGPAPFYEPVEPAATTYFANCSEARAAGSAPVRYGDAGYAPHLDRDGDGVGCE